MKSSNAAAGGLVASDVATCAEPVGTRRRPRRDAMSKSSARGPSSTTSSPICPVSTRIARARRTMSPAVASTCPTIAADAPTTLASRTAVAWLRSGTLGTRSRSIASRRSAREIAGTPAARSSPVTTTAASSPSHSAFGSSDVAWNGITIGRADSAGVCPCAAPLVAAQAATPAARTAAQLRITGLVSPAARPARSGSVARRWRGSRRSQRGRRGRTAR